MAAFLTAFHFSTRAFGLFTIGYWAFQAGQIVTGQLNGVTASIQAALTIVP